jgi:hypothetical protein
MALEPNVRPEVQHLQGATPQEREAVELVAACVESWERGIGPNFQDRNNRFYRQYRSFSKWHSAWVQAGENDRDGLLHDAKGTWGAHLHIPLSFRTIEVMVPRAIAHRPRMLYLPRRERWAENVEAVKLLVDSQQENIDIDLPFQAVMRSGRIYGIGIGKTYWRKEYAPRRRVKQRFLRAPGQSRFTLGRLEQECTFDDPMFEDIDVFDFMWDPFGSSPETCGWMLHRTWLGLDGILSRIRNGVWNTPSVKWLMSEGREEERLRSMGNGQKYDEIWADRMEASGLGSVRASERGEQIHEVWEWHNGHRVLTVLDRQVLVQDAENPCVGRMPFQTYRPTPLQKQMVGIGDLEPLEHLQRELDTLRSQRRDAATLALAAGYVYDDAAIEEEDLQWGPHAAIRVTNSRPSDAIFPIPVRDVPGSSWQEEQVIRQDFDLVPGISDAMDPNRSQVSTATEAQLVQAALSARIELASRRFEIEVVRNAARNFLRLNQRMILQEREMMVPEPGYDQMRAQNEGRWRQVMLDPSMLQGEFHIIPEGGSMAARNIPQDRQDAAQIMNMFGQNPFIDGRRPLMKALELFGVRDPESWLKQSDPPVPPMALQVLEQAGVSRALLDRAVQVAQQQDPRLAEQGPNVQEVDQMMQPQEMAA